MTVVSNTSPICNLAIIGQLPLLRAEFDLVQIPRAVLDELHALNHPAGLASVQGALAAGWLMPTAVRNASTVRAFGLSLDRGEAEAIALAMELPADLLLLDEAEGRDMATAIGLRVRGILGVLREAKRCRRVSSIRDLIWKLRVEAHFFVAPALEAEFLRSVGE